MPQLYIKKPIPVEALQWTGKNLREIIIFVGPDNLYFDENKVEGGLIIKTLKRESLAGIGDYIIKGPFGEFYPVEEESFNFTYERIEN